MVVLSGQLYLVAIKLQCKQNNSREKRETKSERSTTCTKMLIISIETRLKVKQKVNQNMFSQLGFKVLNVGQFPQTKTYWY
jgi:hypothetical protein